MKAHFLAVAALLVSFGAQAGDSLTFQTVQVVEADAQIATAAQKLMIKMVIDKLDFAKEDGLTQASHIRCKTDFMPYGKPGYISKCSVDLKTVNTTLRAEARLISRGTKKGLKEQARFGSQMPTEMKIEFLKFCRSPHLTVINTENNQVALSEASNDCSMLTTDIN